MDGVGVLVGLGSLHCQFPLHSGQNLTILVQYRVPGVGSLFELRVSLVLVTKTHVIISLVSFEHFSLHNTEYACQTYHQVHFEAVVELQSRYIVGLLKVVNHQKFSVWEAASTLEELLQTLLKHKAELTLGSKDTKRDKC